MRKYENFPIENPEVTWHESDAHPRRPQPMKGHDHSIRSGISSQKTSRRVLR